MKTESRRGNTGIRGSVLGICLLSVGWLSLVTCVSPETGRSNTGVQSAESPISETKAPSHDAPTPVPRSSTQRPATEQTGFGAEVKVRRPVPIPGSLVSILNGDPSVQAVVRTSGEPFSAKWFVASEVSLNEDGLADLIVGAHDARLLGANMAPFWVFINSSAGYKSALKVDTLVLDILEGTTNGVRDIRTEEVSAGKRFITVYGYAGEKYAEKSSSTKDIDVKSLKP